MPETRYARSGDVMVAYQVLGEGPFDVVYVPGAISHVELQWDAAGLAALLRRRNSVTTNGQGSLRRVPEARPVPVRRGRPRR